MCPYFVEQNIMEVYENGTFAQCMKRKERISAPVFPIWGEINVQKVFWNAEQQWVADYNV